MHRAHAKPVLLSQFDFTDIALFVNIADTNSVTHGADRSNISASAASTRIKHVEARIGARLLERNARGVTLTHAGEAFLRYSRKLIHELQNFQLDITDNSRSQSTYVRLLVATNAVSDFLSSVVRQYLAACPHVNVFMQEHPALDVVRAVSRGAADIGVITATEHPDGLDIVPYTTDRLVLVVGLAHSLAAQRAIPFQDTLDFDYVGLDINAVGSPFAEAANALPRPPKLRIRVGNFEALGRMIESNLGIGIMPESAALQYQRTMRFQIVELSDDWALRDLNICARDRRELSPSARALVDQLVADGKSRLCFKP